jgi:hypothetical protein
LLALRRLGVTSGHGAATGTLFASGGKAALAAEGGSKHVDET